MRLIDADALKEVFRERESYHSLKLPYDVIIDNAPTVDVTRKIQSELISEVCHSIARQFSEHNEVVPFWLSIGDIRIKEAENE
ncbi:MAG: hypothetical protein J6R32_03170 [Bacteroidales bacterium]|nr:hypothetical protein [Bacteroidales bacterium]